MKTETYLNVHGVPISHKVNDQGVSVGYVVANFGEDLYTFQEAVNVACNLFCIRLGLVDEKGHPQILVPDTDYNFKSEELGT